MATSPAAADKLSAPQGIGRLLASAVALLLAACGSAPRVPEEPELSPAAARTLTLRLLPPGVGEREGWAIDLVAALSATGQRVDAANLCSVIAVTEQESGFRVDPAVPGLPKIAWREIETRAAAAHLPMGVVRRALGTRSGDGRSYAARIDAAGTERDLSEIFEDLIARVPLGATFLADRNPVRTAGPMQVSVSYAEHYVEQRTYPYPQPRGVRAEVFTRRGGLYFGAAHLLDYPNDYAEPRFRFADYNAGHYASRNAAFQNALTVASGIPLDLDGDLLLPGAAFDSPGATERAARVLADRLDLSAHAIREDLGRGDDERFGRTPLYERVFERADRLQGSPLPRAVLPQIRLQSPKITRALTTAWFAERVQERYQRCRARERAP